MKPWLRKVIAVGSVILICGVGIHSGDHRHSDPTTATQEHQQPVIQKPQQPAPAQSEEAEHPEVKPGPPAGEMLGIHVASATVSNASAVVGTTLAFETTPDLYFGVWPFAFWGVLVFVGLALLSRKQRSFHAGPTQAEQPSR